MMPSGVAQGKFGEARDRILDVVAMREHPNTALPEHFV